MPATGDLKKNSFENPSGGVPGKMFWHFVNPPRGGGVGGGGGGVSRGMVQDKF